MIEQSIAELFEAQAARTPEAIALVHEDELLTYQQLNRRSNQLAHELIEAGARPDTLIGVCMQRSVDMVVALLGILKAGAAYVPLDPSYPVSRLAYMLEDSGTELVLTHSASVDSLPDLESVKAVPLDQQWERMARHSSRNPARSVHPHHLAYVIYTSGSTGQPKGVAIDQGNAAAFLLWTRSAYTPAQLQRTLFSTSICFDLSIFECFAPLISGATVVIVRSVLDLLNAPTPVSLINTVPSAAKELLRSATTLSGVDTINLAGEPLARALVDQLYQTDVRSVINLYGPSEYTTYSTMAVMSAADVQAPCIGGPIANTQIHLLDEHLNPVPMGVAGELYVGGAGLARGYLNRPELTAERFVPNPFAAQSGQRLYRTGDLARYRADDNIEFIGRIDHQIKLRGVRIELGEIEATLLEHPAVQECTVLAAPAHPALEAFAHPCAAAREDAGQPKRLVGYIVTHPEQVVQPRELRQFLQQRLPDTMVPAAFVFLPALPLTLNGKLDRHALPAPDVQQQLSEEYVAPLTELERTLAQIWSQVLGVANIGAEDDFFALGGDSLLSIQIVSKAKARGIPLNYKMIFRNATIRRLAASVETDPVPRSPTSASGEAPLTPIQRRFFETARQDVDHWNQWVLMDLSSSLRFQDLYLSVAQLFKVHDVLRLQFQFEDGVWTQRYAAPNDRLPVEWINLPDSSVANQNDVLEPLIRGANESLDPRQGKLIRIVYFDCGAAAPHKLLIVVHHLIMDNVSFHILVNDLDACLAQCARGLAPRLENNTSTYKAWSEALTNAAQDGFFESESEYWLAQMQPISQRIPYDTEAEAAENTYAAMRSCEISFAERETLTIVNKLPALLHCHVNAVLLDALARALCECFDIAETVIDIESHGRHWIADDVDLRKTTGWYTSIFPQRISNSRGRSVYDRMRAIDRQLRAVPKEGLGYGVLRYLSRSDASQWLRQMPNAQVCFNYLGQIGRGAKSLSALSTENMRIGSSHSDSLQRSHLLLFQGAVTAGKLAIQCYYSTRFHHEDTIKRVLARLRQNLTGLLPSVAASLRRSFQQLMWARSEAQGVDEILEGISVCYPLLGIQTSILFQHLSSSDAVPPYLVQVSCMLRGNLVIAAFEKAWQVVVSRHESLRTSFHWTGLDAPIQAVHRNVVASLEVLNWQDKDEVTKKADLASALRQDRKRGFALDSAELLMRVVVIRLDQDQYFCIWSHHHIQVDGWSQIVVLRELFQIYKAIVNDEAMSLPSPPSLGGYFDALDKFPTMAARNYWRRYLQGFHEPTPILATGTDSELGDKKGSYREIAMRIGPAESAAIHEFAKSNSLTLHTVFRSLWGFWLFIHSARDDVVFGNVVAGRNADMEAVDSLIGTFINTIPVRMILDESVGLLDWLQKVQDEQASSHRYELFPLADTLKLAETNREGLLFASILVFENLPGSYADIVADAGFHLESMDCKIQENYPVVVSIRPESTVTIKINYREDIVDPRIHHAEVFFDVVLRSLIRSSDRSLLLFRNAVREQYYQLLNGIGGQHGKRKQSVN